MIPLQRDRTRLPPSFRHPGRDQRLLELFRAARDGQLTVEAVKRKLFSSGRWNPTKRALGLESNFKCAFCETPTSAGYYGDVEHFRPKSIYWWLAYCYENYLYSCRVCNGKKSDQYLRGGAALVAPLLAAGQDDVALLALASTASPEPGDDASITALLVQLDNERPFLPNPYRLDPRLLFRWRVDTVLQEVRMEPRPGVPEADVAFDAAERMLDINRPELLLWRFRTYLGLARLKAVADVATGEALALTLEALRAAADPSEPYSAMVIYFAHEEWGLI
jgi:hypothetical protein